ncbi:MAG: TolC family protein [Blastocatellia bacterium]
MKRFRKNLMTAVITTFAIAGVSSVFGQEQQVARNITDVKVVPVTFESFSRGTIATESVSTNLSRVGVQTSEPLPLSLSDAIRKALENNNSVDITRDDVRFQETQVRSQLGIYDPVFTVTPNYTRNSTTGSSATNDFTVNANMQHFIRPGGGSYSVFFNNTRTENAFAQAQVSSGSISSGGSSAIYSSSWGFRYTQPLFRNLRIDNTRRNITIARRRLEQTDLDFRKQVEDTISLVQNAYWDLVFALRDQQNRVANLDLSRENLRQIEARIAAGATAPLARAEVATELANREGDLLLATQQVSIAENALKQLVLREATSPEWLRTFIPTDKPVISPEAANMDTALKSAMDNRFELRRLKLANDINNVDISFFKNQLRPQIDLNTTFSLDGLARGGAITADTVVPLISSDPTSIATNSSAFLLSELRRLNPTATIVVPNVTIPGTPSFLSGGFNRSLANTFRSDAPNFSVGVTISFPLRNQTAKANLAGAQITQNQIASQIRQQEQTVIVDVRNAVQAVETARQRVLTSRRARENAEIQLDGERRLFDAGRSTTFLLFQRENALTNARNAEIRAETDYSKAVADLQRVTSTTFQVNNIVIESPIDKK